jgi:hypothetical protein
MLLEVVQLLGGKLFEVSNSAAPWLEAIETHIFIYSHG